MPQDSPNWRMADRLAGGRLDEIVAKWVGEGRNWERISRDLYADFGAEVTGVTLRAWYGKATERAAS